MNPLELLRDHERLLYSLAILSVVSLALTAIILPVVVIRLPADYFTRDRTAWRTEHRGPLDLCWHLGKNLLGGTFLLAGLAMLVLPGQGLLTLLIGILLLDFPGKFRLERWLICRASILRTVNRLRIRRGRPPLASPCAKDHPRERQQT